MIGTLQPAGKFLVGGGGGGGVGCFGNLVRIRNRGTVYLGLLVRKTAKGDPPNLAIVLYLSSGSSKREKKVCVPEREREKGRGRRIGDFEWGTSLSKNT